MKLTHTLSFQFKSNIVVSHRGFNKCETLNAKRLILLGIEWEQGQVIVRDLVTREQILKTVDELIAMS